MSKGNHVLKQFYSPYPLKKIYIREKRKNREQYEQRVFIGEIG
jgi:hypothetical protein